MWRFAQPAIDNTPAPWDRPPDVKRLGDSLPLSQMLNLPLGNLQKPGKLPLCVNPGGGPSIVFETLRENTIDFAPENFHSFTRLNVRERPKRRGETGGAKACSRAFAGTFRVRVGTFRVRSEKGRV
jgi:hypothetical protein